MDEVHKCLEKKNLKSIFDFNDKNLLKYMCFGFLFKKKDKLKNQKRFFFLISSRPVSNNDYKQDNVNLESSTLPCWMNFDTLYYYKFENELDDSKQKGEISLW
jgi:hypothetical protein